MSTFWSRFWKVALAVWIVGALYIVLAFRIFTTPSGSMLPTLHVGDYLIVSKMAYGLSNYSLPFHPDLFKGRLFGAHPARGDVVIFALPRDPSVDYIKRIIGLPGDVVQMKDGRLYINDTIVPRAPIAKESAPDFYGKTVEVPTYRETLPNGVTFTIIEIQGDTGFNDNTPAMTVPADAYFVLGDNRDNSTDSRVSPDQGGVGFVPYDHLIGRAEFVFLENRNGEQSGTFRSVH